MSNFWQRLSKRERGLVLLTGLIVIVFIGKYAAVTPLLERRQWVTSQLESQPRLLQKNIRYIGQKEMLMASL
ncbi:MAG: type II secretion system protein GspM, partial [Candidatus Binatia bacterium]